jgi:Flp pilus assembly pilin Flp
MFATAAALLLALKSDRKAGASFEYVVLATLISVAVSSAASPTGTKLAATYSSIASSVQALT